MPFFVNSADAKVGWHTNHLNVRIILGRTRKDKSVTPAFIIHELFAK